MIGGLKRQNGRCVLARMVQIQLLRQVDLRHGPMLLLQFATNFPGVDAARCTFCFILTHLKRHLLASGCMN